MVVGNRKNSGGGGDKGKNKTTFVQNSNPSDFSIITVIPTRKKFKDRGSNLGRRSCHINGIESNSIKSELTSDVFNMEPGKIRDGL